jgi:hypothetical protein
LTGLDPLPQPFSIAGSEGSAVLGDPAWIEDVPGVSALLSGGSLEPSPIAASNPEGLREEALDPSSVADGSDGITGLDHQAAMLRPSAPGLRGRKRYSFDLSIDVNGVEISSKGRVRGARRFDIRSSIDGS